LSATAAAREVAAEFPVLRREIDGHPITYLDSAATSQTPQPVIDAMTRYYTETRASIHRGVYPLAVEATDLYEGARARTAEWLRSTPDRARRQASTLGIMPESMTPAQAALVEPLSVALHSRNLAPLGPDSRIAILGAGPIGLSILLACRAAFGELICYVTDLIDARLEAARRCGAQSTGNPEREDAVGSVAALEPLGLDVVFECAGSGPGWWSRRRPKPSGGCSGSRSRSTRFAR